MEKGQNPYTLRNIKYATLVSWSSSGKYAIVIGQNPSQAQTLKAYTYNVDDTNWNIIKVLKQNGYDGYIMLNTFPEIDPSGKKYTGANVIPQQEELNIKISKYLIRHMRNVEIILACTVTNFISKKYYDEIICKNNVQYISSPKITHFATQALGTLKKYDPITITQANVQIAKENNSNCIISF